MYAPFWKRCLGLVERRLGQRKRTRKQLPTRRTSRRLALEPLEDRMLLANLGDFAIVDLNGDKIPDLAIIDKEFLDAAVLLGRGDGTFDRAGYLKINGAPEQIVAADFNKDQIEDLAIMEVGNRKAHVLMGNGDGTFAPATVYSLSNDPTFVINGDFNNDGREDLLTASDKSFGFSLLLGLGNGIFHEELGSVNPNNIKDFEGIKQIIAADLDGDQVNDDVLYLRNDANDGRNGSKEIGILSGQLTGIFQPSRLRLIDPPRSVSAADINGDGFVDLIANDQDHVVTLLGRSSGKYESAISYLTDFPLGDMLMAEINGEKGLDLVFTPAVRALQLSIFHGKDNGTFEAPTSVAVGSVPVDVAAADFNLDEKMDMMVISQQGDIQILLADDRGTFLTPSPNIAVGQSPQALVTADFNRDGRNDVATVNRISDDVSILLGHGDGRFSVLDSIAVGERPRHLIAADWNNDGRLDLAVADQDGISFLFGLGDGTFAKRTLFRVGGAPTFLASADFNADGYLDLAAALPGVGRQPGRLTIILGSPGGTFRVSQTVVTGQNPSALVISDFSGDGMVDVALMNRRSRDIAVMLGRGDGSVRPHRSYALDGVPIGLVMGDYSGDGVIDLITVTSPVDGNATPRLIILNGRTDGTFRVTRSSLAIKNPEFPGRNQPRFLPLNPRHLQGFNLGAGDKPDLIVADRSFGVFLHSIGRGRFAARQVAAYRGSVAATIGHFDDDKIIDLASIRDTDDVSILANLGEGRFTTFLSALNPIKPSPFYADLSGDGVGDLTATDKIGNILFREGRTRNRAEFDSPILLNVGQPVRDVAMVAGPLGSRLAALDVPGTALHIYTAGPKGPQLTSDISLQGSHATQIESADMNGDLWSDVVILRSGITPSVAVYLGNAAGGIATSPVEFDVGYGTSDFYLADSNMDGWIDIVLVNQLSGVCTVMWHTKRDTAFRSGQPLAMGRGLAGFNPKATDLVGVTPDNLLGLTVADFNEDDAPDMVAGNTGSEGFTILWGEDKRPGTYRGPEYKPTFTRPGSVTNADLDGDGFLDLILLDRQGIEIFMNDGGKNLQSESKISIGIALTGLTVIPNILNKPGRESIADLVISNALGDTYVLLNNGDGTFAAPQTTSLIGGKVSLAITNDQSKDGKLQYVITEPDPNDLNARRVTISCAKTGECFKNDDKTNLTTPTAVSVADVDVDGRLDLVVGDGGANAVIVYLGTADGTFGAGQSIAVGTNPVALTVEDLDKDGLPDLVVANEGSNDVSILMGQVQRGQWNLSPGPRLKAGAGPVGTAVEDVTGPGGEPDGLLDVVVANGRADNVFQFRGLGNGFFADQQPIIIPVGVAPLPPRIEDLDGDRKLDLFTVNSGSNNMTFVSGFDPSKTMSLSTGGFRPVAAVVDDIDDDGFNDVLVAHNGDGILSLFRGLTDGIANVETFRSGVLHLTSLALSPFGGVYATEAGSTSVIALRNLLDSLVPGFDLANGIAPAPKSPPPPFALVPGLREDEGIPMGTSAARIDDAVEKEGAEADATANGRENLESSQASAGGLDGVIDEQPSEEVSRLHKRNRHMFGIRDALPKQSDESEKTPLPEMPAEFDRQPRSELPKEAIESNIPAPVPTQEARVSTPAETINPIPDSTENGSALSSVDESTAPVRESKGSGSSLGILLSLFALNQYADVWFRRKKKTTAPHVDRKAATIYPA